MSIILVGLDHRTAPLTLREQLALNGDTLRGTLDAARALPGGLVREVVILSTCNRLELYAEGAAAAVEPLQALLAQVGAVPLAELRPHLTILQDEATVAHLLRVAAGVESAVLGETQVLGQVAEALAIAQGAGASGALLARLFEQAIHTGKRARAETEISRHTTSISQAAAHLVPAHSRVLIVGAGEMATLAAQALAAQGGHEITILNRTYERAAALARSVGGRALDWLQFGSALARADAIIGATSAPRPILTAADLAGQPRPLLVLDLGLPRNVDPAVGALPHVTHWTLDDLQALVTANLAQRGAAVPLVETLVADETAQFFDWLHSRAVAPVITDLQRWARAVAETEVAQALNKLDAPDAHTEQVITRLAHRLIAKLLHEPTVRLKQHAGSGDGLDYADALRDLFGLDAAALASTAALTVDDSLSHEPPYVR